MCLGVPFGRGQPRNHRETMKVLEKIGFRSPFRDLEVVWSGVCVVDEMRSWNRGREGKGGVVLSTFTGWPVSSSGSLH